MPRLLSVATAGAVSVGVAFGVIPASADPPPDQPVSLAVDIVGDSYMAGEGIPGTYLDPADPRHRSVVAPALQALSRLESSNARLRVDANVVAASGARTADFFTAQKGPDNVVVNAPQHDQIRPDAQLVIVGFGGEDVHLATVVADAKRTTNGPNVVLDKEIRDLGPLLDSTAPDEEYFAQARSAPLGAAPTLVARMLQVLAGIKVRAPHATIVVTNYPLATDPQNKHAASLVGEDELTSVRKFEHDLNKAIEHAVRLCQCAGLVDLSAAVAGHEAYTADSAYNEQPDPQAPRERFQPNQKGASLIANPIATGLAGLLRITPPAPSDGRMTVPKNIAIHNGVARRDPTHAEHTPKPANPPHPAPAPRAAHPISGVTRAVTGLVSGLTQARGQKRPNDQHVPVQTPAPAPKAQPRTDTNRHDPGPAATDRTPPAGTDQRRPAPAPVAPPRQVPAEPDRGRPGTFFRVVTDRAGSQPPQAVPASAGQSPNPAPVPPGQRVAGGMDGGGSVLDIPGWTVMSVTNDSKNSNPSPATPDLPAYAVVSTKGRTIS